MQPKSAASNFVGITLAVLVCCWIGIVPVRGDCPGCEWDVLVPPAEMIALDLPVPFVRTFLWGAAGGGMGLVAGSVIAYPFLKDGFSAIVLGGLIAGLPAGMLVGQYLSVPPREPAEANLSFSHSGGLRFVLLPVRRGGLAEVLYGF